MNKIELKPVGQVILNKDTPNRSPRLEHYLIPYYQRGYRWDVENVEALLDDIHNFMLSDEKKYCLQPIVVAPTIDEEGFNIWEVIDGQQRLITMNIIFNYLNRPRYFIQFDKRGKSTDFLHHLSPQSYKHNEPDFHFMSQAYEIVKVWFEEKTQNDVGYIDDFNSTLTKRVEVIWYQIEELQDITNEDEIESKKIDIFNRLNIGKIPLTDAELIRALLLSKIKYGLSEREAILRQSEISAEWHRIEMELRNEEFWFFINNKEIGETASTIEFIFKLIAENNTKKYSTYLWFEKEIKSESLDEKIKNEEEANKAEKLWKKTKEYFGKLKYWFENDYLYHHLGYIIALENSPVTTIRNFIKNADCKKTEFQLWAFQEVKNKVAEIDLQDVNYEKGTADLTKVFLLHNILTSETLQTAQKNRFPFNLHKKTDKDGGWSIEHIHAQQSKEMKEINAIKKWLEDTYQAIKDIQIIEKKNTRDENQSEIEVDIQKYKEQIIAMKESETIDLEEFNMLKNKLIEVFDSESVHVLDNLALLSKRHNSSLNNAIFPVKRNKILQFDKEGQYIPIATKNAFLKYHSDSNLQPYYWSRTDKEAYYKDIEEKLQPYLTPKSVTNEQ